MCPSGLWLCICLLSLSGPQVSAHMRCCGPCPRPTPGPVQESWRLLVLPRIQAMGRRPIPEVHGWLWRLMPRSTVVTERVLERAQQTDGSQVAARSAGESDATSLPQPPFPCRGFVLMLSCPCDSVELLSSQAPVPWNGAPLFPCNVNRSADPITSRGGQPSGSGTGAVIRVSSGPRFRKALKSTENRVPRPPHCPQEAG